MVFCGGEYHRHNSLKNIRKCKKSAQNTGGNYGQIENNCNGADAWLSS
jgi:hypothetical protein